MFFMSVKKDLNKWTEYYSPTYKETFFHLNNWKSDLFNYLELRTVSKGEEKISTYQFLFIPIDLKVWWYARKIKRHFKKMEIDKKVSKNIETLKSGLDDIECNFIKEIRKEKLEKIKDK